MKSHLFRMVRVPRPQRGPVFLGSLAVLIVGIAAVAGSTAVGRALPSCRVKQTTGWPCPSCGSQRAIESLCAGDLAAAARFNPLVSLALVGGGVGIIWAWMAVFLSVPWLSLAPSAWRKIAWMVAGLLVANWSYLVAVGR